MAAYEAADRIMSTDETFDTFCTSCMKSSNSQKAADKLCLDCSKFLCDKCLQYHDNVFPDEHKLLDKSEFTGQEAAMMLLERCDRHRGEILKLWCRYHDDVACSTCVATDHRSCPDVQYIPDILHVIFKEDDVEVAMDTMVNILKDTNKKEVASSKSDENEPEVIARQQVELNQLAIKVTQIIEDIIGAEKQKFKSIHKELIELKKREYEASNKLQATSESNMRLLEKSGQMTAQRFVALKRCQKLSTEVEAVRKLKLSIEQDLALQQFDKLEVTRKVIEKIRDVVKGEVTRFADVCRISPLKSSFNLNIALPSEKTCNSLSLCVLQSGLLLVTDCNNRSLKLLDPEHNIILDHCEVQAGPIAVCQVNSEEIVATLNNCSLQFASIKNKLMPTRTIMMKEPLHDCCGLVFDGEKLYISSILHANIYVKDLNGNNLQTIREDQHGERLYQNLRHIAVSVDDGKLYAADMRNGMTCTTSQGRLLYRTIQTGLSEIGGLCPDGNGGLYLCGVDSMCITHIDSKGENMCTLIDVVDEDFPTRSVTFDAKTKRLYVTKYFCDTITVVQM